MEQIKMNKLDKAFKEGFKKEAGMGSKFLDSLGSLGGQTRVMTGMGMDTRDMIGNKTRHLFGQGDDAMFQQFKNQKADELATDSKSADEVINEFDAYDEASFDEYAKNQWDYAKDMETDFADAKWGDRAVGAGVGTLGIGSTLGMAEMSGMTNFFGE